MRAPGPATVIHPASAILIVALAAQIGLWNVGRSVMHKQSIVPPVPARASAEALSFGDTQVAYRAMGLRLQNFGDTGGRWSALSDYDYDRLLDWFDLLVAFDDRAWYVPALAAGYYVHTPRRDDARRVVEFLVTFARRDNAKRWRLLAHAVYLARHRVRDLPYALEIATELQSVEADDMPFWPRQLPALILAEMGRVEDAEREIQSLGARFPEMPAEEARYQAYFLEHVLGVSPTVTPTEQ